MAEKVSVRELFATLGLEIDEKGFDRAEALIHGIKHGLVEAIAGVAGVGIALTAMGVSTAHAGIEAWKAAQALGTTTDAIQELDGVAAEAFISGEELQQSLKFLAKNAAQAANGSAELNHAFKALGITLDKNNLPPVDELLEQVADGFNKNVPAAQRTAMAMKLMGRSGAQMAGTLGLGAEKIRELREEQHDLGAVIDKDGIAKSLEFGRSMNQLEHTFKGLKYTIGVPVLTAINGFLRGIVGATKAIREFFRGEFPKAVAVFRVALAAAVVGLVAFGIANAAVVAETLAGWAAMAVGSTIGAAIIAAEWIAAAAPFIPLAVAVLIAAVALEDLYSFLTGKRSVIGDAVKDIGYLRGEYESWRDVLKDIADWLASVTGLLSGHGLDAMHDAEINRVFNAALHPRGISSSAEQSLAANGVYTPGASSPTVNVTVTPLPGMDEAALAEMTGRQIRDQLDSITRAAKEAIP